MKKTIDQIVSAYRLLDAAKLTKMESTEKFSVIKETRPLRKIGKDFDEFLKDAQTRLKPEGFDAIVAKLQQKEDLSEEENSLVAKYDKDVAECMKDELAKEVDIDITPLAPEVLQHLMDSNDWTVGQSMIVCDVIE